ncbi:Aldo/keto reductase [Fistulina hepatica ATCC 64428]|uniref:Aldo/keto reductase n=1 Tax=Fistulina hepatica ATCC 64428 TaxID=1128425 RepID=A0A0D7A9G4_9AGAR|nr:Aldo/keto reductase [Fistulina hepatica ATCC 64428]
MPFPTRRLGKNGPIVSAIGLGTMGFGSTAIYGKNNTDDTAVWDMLDKAAGVGVTFWDTADMYGSEDILGKWFEATGRRAEIFLCTKFGARDQSPNNPIPFNQRKPNSKPSYIRWRLEESLRQMRTDYIDLYYQHRVDPTVPIEVVIETLREPVLSGKVRWVGLSECSPEVLRRARADPAIGDRVIACQMEYSVMTLDIEKNGFAEAMKETGAGLVAYSPLCRGLLTGKIKSPDDFEENDLRRLLPRFSKENFPKNLAIVDKVSAFGGKLGQYSWGSDHATAGQIALAWILADYPDGIAIPGSRTVKRFAENAYAAYIKLKPEDVAAVRQVAENAEVAGARYPEIYVSVRDCIPLDSWNGE